MSPAFQSTHSESEWPLPVNWELKLKLDMWWKPFGTGVAPTHTHTHAPTQGFGYCDSNLGHRATTPQAQANSGQVEDDVWWKICIVHDSCLILDMIATPNPTCFWEVMTMSSWWWNFQISPKIWKLMCANHQMTTVEQDGRALFPKFRPCPQDAVLLNDRFWTCPQAAIIRKKRDVMVLLLGGCLVRNLLTGCYNT